MAKEQRIIDVETQQRGIMIQDGGQSDDALRLLVRVAEIQQLQRRIGLQRRRESHPPGIADLIAVDAQSLHGLIGGHGGAQRGAAFRADFDARQDETLEGTSRFLEKRRDSQRARIADPVVPQVEPDHRRIPAQRPAKRIDVGVGETRFRRADEMIVAGNV